jgi:hypothetical protein
MTRDKLLKLIEEHGLTLHGDIEHFAALIEQEMLTNQKIWHYQEGVEDEREECARLAENGLIGHTIAKAIRARGER